MKTLIAAGLFLLLSLVSSAEDFTLHATCDNKMKLYLDGKQKALPAASADHWTKTTTVKIPSSTRFLEIHCQDLGQPGAILASGSNGLRTNGEWSCSNGKSWGPAYVIGPNGMKPWGPRPDIPTSAKWIWTKGWKGQDLNVKCKIDLGNQIPPGVTPIPGCNCSDKKLKNQFDGDIGACLVTLKGKFWCYLEQGENSGCPDKKKSSRPGNLWWGYKACEWYTEYQPNTGK